MSAIAAPTATSAAIVRPRPGTTRIASRATIGRTMSQPRLCPSRAAPARRPAAPRNNPRSGAGMPRRPASTAHGSSPSIQSPTFAFVYPTGCAKRASSKNWPAWSAPEALSSSIRARAAIPEPECAQGDRGGAVPERPERAQRQDQRVQQRPVAGVPGKLRLVRPQHGEQREDAVTGEQQDRRRRSARGARPRQHCEADHENRPEEQGRRRPRGTRDAATVDSEPEHDRDRDERGHQAGIALHHPGRAPSVYRGRGWCRCS